MRNGDLSNEIAPTVGMRFERVIKTGEGKLNRSAKAYLQSINRLDINVVIITTGADRLAAAFCYKWGVPYFRVVPAESPLEIPDIVREMNMMTYYDLDTDILQNVNSRGGGKVEVKQWTQVSVL